MLQFIKAHVWGIGLIAFVLVLMFAFRVDQQHRHDQLKQAHLVICNQDNQLRRRLNDQAEVTEKFFLDAAASRQKQGEIATAQSLKAKRQGNNPSLAATFAAEAKLSYEVAKDYRDSAAAYQETLPLVDCHATYEKGRTVFRR